MPTIGLACSSTSTVVRGCCSPAIASTSLASLLESLESLLGDCKATDIILLTARSYSQVFVVYPPLVLSFVFVMCVWTALNEGKKNFSLTPLVSLLLPPIRCLLAFLSAVSYLLIARVRVNGKRWRCFQTTNGQDRHCRAWHLRELVPTAKNGLIVVEWPAIGTNSPSDKAICRTVFSNDFVRIILWGTSYVAELMLGTNQAALTH